MKLSHLVALSVIGLSITGCGTQPALSAGASNSTVTSPKVTISNAHIVKNDGKNVSVALTVNNSADKAVKVNIDDFAFISKSTVLSPNSSSQVPQQIPAHTKASVSLVFRVNGRLTGTVKPKVGYQPSTGTPEEFASLGTMTIKKPVVAKKKSVSTLTFVPQYVIKVDGKPQADAEVNLQFSGIPNGYTLTTLEMIEGQNTVTETLDQAGANNTQPSLSAQFSVSPDGSVITFGFDNAMGGGEGQFVFTFRNSSGNTIEAKSPEFGILS